ncbi:MAG: hypothetical protein ACRD44_02170 [Bryobacteraceae bacterium]
MSFRLGRILLLIGGLIMIFGVVTVVLLRVMPGQRKETDYLVVGTLATFIMLGVLFVVLITTWVRTPDVFYKKRLPPEE